MPVVRLLVLVLALAACTSNATNSSPAPAGTVTPVQSVAPVPSPAPSASVAADATAGPSSVAESAAPSGACIDRGLLADAADSANNSLRGLDAAVKANQLTEASTLAAAAASQLRSLATVVETGRPLAATALRAAADKLDAAKADMAGNKESIGAVLTAFNQAYDLANAGACPA
jgi:hypothetical protein